MNLKKIKDKDPLINSFFKTREVFGIPFWKLDMIGGAVFGVGAVLAQTTLFRVFCLFMAAWFVLFIYIDFMEYKKVYKK